MVSRVWKRRDTIVKRTSEAETQSTAWCSTRKKLARTDQEKKKGHGRGLEVGALDMTRGATKGIDEIMMTTDGITVNEAATKVAIEGVETDSMEKNSPAGQCRCVTMAP